MAQTFEHTHTKDGDSFSGIDTDRRHIEVAVDLFAMLADVTRVLLILALRNGEQPVNRLAEIVDKSPAAVSQHLAKLRLARLVVSRQEGTKVYYSLANEHPARIISDAIFQAEHSLDEIPRHHQLKGQNAP